MRFVPAVKQATRISLSTALPVPPREHSLPVYYLVQNHSLPGHEQEYDGYKKLARSGDQH